MQSFLLLNCNKPQRTQKIDKLSPLHRIQLINQARLYDNLLTFVAHKTFASPPRISELKHQLMFRENVPNFHEAKSKN